MCLCSFVSKTETVFRMAIRDYLYLGVTFEKPALCEPFCHPPDSVDQRKKMFQYFPHGFDMSIKTMNNPRKLFSTPMKYSV